MDDLQDDYKMDWDYRLASNGNVVQTAKTSLNGLPGNQHFTLSLGFGGGEVGALSEAQGSLTNGFQRRRDGLSGRLAQLPEVTRARPKALRVCKRHTMYPP